MRTPRIQSRKKIRKKEQSNKTKEENSVNKCMQKINRDQSK